MVPWEICGTAVVLEAPADESPTRPFKAIEVIPMAGVDGNEERLGVRIRPDDAGRLSGRLSATWNVKNDPFLKLEIARASVKSRTDALESMRKLVLPHALQWTALEESLTIGETSISFACSIEVDGLVRDAGEERLCDLGDIRCDDYSIPEGAREANLDFHLPRRIATNVTLVPPEGFEPGDLQEPFQMVESYAEFRQWITRDDGEVTLHRDLLLPHCAYMAESADLFRSFFLQMQKNDAQPIALRRTGRQ
jgi:hypothetical protein